MAQTPEPCQPWLQADQAEVRAIPCLNLNTKRASQEFKFQGNKRLKLGGRLLLSEVFPQIFAYLDPSSVSPVDKELLGDPDLEQISRADLVMK